MCVLLFYAVALQAQAAAVSLLLVVLTAFRSLRAAASARGVTRPCPLTSRKKGAGSAICSAAQAEVYLLRGSDVCASTDITASVLCVRTAASISADQAAFLASTCSKCRVVHCTFNSSTLMQSRTMCVTDLEQLLQHTQSSALEMRILRY
jgi:hypothetical protein